ncbi:RICIN domain-containing protein [Streptomyces roseifaciens]
MRTRSTSWARNDPAFNVTGEYEVASRASGGKILDVDNLGLQDTANILQWERNVGTNQRWWVTPVGDGVFVISDVHSGKAMDVTGGSKEDAAHVQQYTFNDTDVQKWRLERV